MSIRIGIMGYGNIGRAVECAAKQSDDLEVVAVFTRRDPSTVSILTPGAKVYKADDAEKMADLIDVMIMCGGSATDLPVQTPALAKTFCIVDSFDTHARIPEHFANVDSAAKAAGTLAAISVGWDPGLFSIERMYSSAILPLGKDYTFWGRGVSQGHSDAIRRVEGVLDARQYTVPVPEAVEAVRSGSNPDLTTRQKHTRECFVVAKDGADKARIEKEIKKCPTTSPIMIPLSPSSQWRSSSAITTVSPTAAELSAQAQQAGTTKIRLSSNTASSSIPTPNSLRAYWLHMQELSTASTRKARPAV